MRASMVAAAALVTLCAVPARANPAVLHFKLPPIEVGANPTLGDIAEVEASDDLVARFDAVALGQAPMPGHRATVTGQELREWIRSEHPDLADAVVWQGPASATILRPGIELALSQLESTAESSLTAWLRARYQSFEVRPIASSPRSLKMSREATIHMVVQGSGASRRMAVWATIHEPGLPDRALPLWFSVSASAQAWVAVRDISAGAEIDDAALQLQVVDVANIPGAIPAGFAAFSEKQAVSPIASGRVLTQRMLVDRPMVAAGDRVKLKGMEGAVTVES
ncbi:MAG: flgA, partial [Nevskia sp.]|nr:flgA [Nevskia sp.]